MRQATPGSNLKGKEATATTLERLPMKSSALPSQNILRAVWHHWGRASTVSCAASLPLEALTVLGADQRDKAALLWRGRWNVQDEDYLPCFIFGASQGYLSA